MQGTTLAMSSQCVEPRSRFLSTKEEAQEPSRPRANLGAPLNEDIAPLNEDIAPLNEDIAPLNEDIAPLNEDIAVLVN